MDRHSYSANETLAASNHRKIASEARVHYTPERSVGPVEICVKILAFVAVLATIVYLMAQAV